MSAKPCGCGWGEMCWRCTPYGRNPRDPEWQAREAARIFLEAFLRADTTPAPLAKNPGDSGGET